MKIWKIVFFFVIFYFLVTIFDGMVGLAQKISFGNRVIEIGVYVFTGLLVMIFLVRPLAAYLFYPSSLLIKKMNDGDAGATRRLYAYYVKKGYIDGEKNLDPVLKRGKVRDMLCTRIAKFDREIHSTALKLTTTVVLSPNSFIDGLSIILGNSRLIYGLSKQLGIRYSLKELADIYFKIFSIASVSGLLEEFDEEIEEFVRELAEVVSKGATREMPFVKIAIGALSPVIQASANYAFVIYNGMRFKYRLLDLVEKGAIDEGSIIKRARGDARRARLSYFGDMAKKVRGNLKAKRRRDKTAPEPAT